MIARQWCWWQGSPPWPFGPLLSSSFPSSSGLSPGESYQQIARQVANIRYLISSKCERILEHSFILGMFSHPGFTSHRPLFYPIKLPLKKTKKKSHRNQSTTCQQTEASVRSHYRVQGKHPNPAVALCYTSEVIAEK